MRAALIAAALAAASCESPVEPECTDAVEVSAQSFTPAPGTPVHAGERIDFAAEFRYSSCHEGRVWLQVRDGNGRSVATTPGPGGSVPNVHLDSGAGVETLRAQIIVPAGVGQISAHGRFENIGSGFASWIVFTADYPVVD